MITNCMRSNNSVQNTQNKSPNVIQVADCKEINCRDKLKKLIETELKYLKKER